MESKEDSQISIKLLVLGDSAVGKTSILIRYVENSFDECCISTLGVDYKVKYIKYKNTKIKLQLWDTSGEEKYRSISTNLIRNTQGLLIVFDLTNEDSFQNIKDWINAADDYNPNLKKILIGNKLDLEDERKVNNEALINFANNKNIKFFETSAKDGTNIEEAFKALVDLLFENKTEQEIIEEYGNQDTSFSIESEKKDKKKKKKNKKDCC